MVVLKIVTMLLGLLVFVLILGFFIMGIQLFVWFHCHSCKHCGHHMEFKGLKPDEDNGHYLFYCNHCGTWEQISQEEFFRKHEHECNPNENQV